VCNASCYSTTGLPVRGAVVQCHGAMVIARKSKPAGGRTYARVVVLPREKGAKCIREPWRRADISCHCAVWSRPWSPSASSLSSPAGWQCPPRSSAPRCYAASYERVASAMVLHVASTDRPIGGEGTTSTCRALIGSVLGGIGTPKSREAAHKLCATRSGGFLPRPFPCCAGGALHCIQ
jgi:hypothetical protein